MGKPAAQSADNTDAARAVDGRRDIAWRHVSCTDVGPYGDDRFWWSVDLGELYNIAHVTITVGEKGIVLLSLLLALS